MKERAKKEVKVITPMPPICTNSRMMVWPTSVKAVETSNVANPVTQTDVVAMNRASMKEIPAVVALGSISSPVPIKITQTKLDRNSNEGLI